MKTTKKARAFLFIGLIGAFLTLIGDLLIGYVKLPEGAGMLESYFAAALCCPVAALILGQLFHLLPWPVGEIGVAFETMGYVLLMAMGLRLCRKCGADMKMGV